MSFDAALRFTEILLALALTQQSLEHMTQKGRERLLHALRIIFCAALLSDYAAFWASLGLLVLTTAILYRFQGPYNGGSDRMSLLIILCLWAAHFAGDTPWREVALGYLALQLVLSYFISGWVKIVNPSWRSGQALSDVFLFSAYPVSKGMRQLAERRLLLFTASWAVMLFELLFPFTVLNQTMLFAALILAGLFHLSNACFFGLNRFFWIWLAAYPSIIWLQGRIAASIGL